MHAENDADSFKQEVASSDEYVTNAGISNINLLISFITDSSFAVIISAYILTMHLLWRAHGHRRVPYNIDLSMVKSDLGRFIYI